MDISVSLTLPPGVTSIPQAAARIMKAWHADSETIASQEVEAVKERTPVRTGALHASVDATWTPDSFRKSNLATVFFNEGNQLAEWNRVYVAYQEGPPLGLATYTNGPRHMLYRAPAEDAAGILAWALDNASQAVAKMGG